MADGSVSRGDRVVVLATEQRGEIDHVQGDGRICVWLDEKTGDAQPTPYAAHEIDYCGIDTSLSAHAARLYDDIPNWKD